MKKINCFGVIESVSDNDVVKVVYGVFLENLLVLFYDIEIFVI